MGIYIKQKGEEGYMKKGFWINILVWIIVKVINLIANIFKKDKGVKNVIRGNRKGLR